MGDLVQLNADIQAMDEDDDILLNLDEEDKEKVLEAIYIVLHFTRKYVTDSAVRRAIRVGMFILKGFL